MNKKSNKSAYSFIYKMRIQKALAYRFDVFANIIFQCIAMFATAFFWKAIYSGYDSVQGAGVGDMLTYTVVSAVMSILFVTTVELKLMESVEKGTVAMDMLKPVPLFSIYFFEDLGNITSLIFINGLPILLIGSLFIGVPLPADRVSAALFFVSLIMSFFINWLFAALFSLLSFVTINMSPLIQVKKHILRLLSGSIIPVWFFPEWAQGILGALPFVYIYQLPLDLFIGRYTLQTAIPKLTVQLVWLVILSGAFYAAQKSMTKKVMVQGG